VAAWPGLRGTQIDAVVGAQRGEPFDIESGSVNPSAAISPASRTVFLLRPLVPAATRPARPC